MASYPTCRECESDLTSAEEEEQELCLECQEQDKEAARRRKTTWYGNFKWLADCIAGKSPADILRVFHRFLDINNKYGSMAIAASAEKSLELLIKDLQRR